MSAPVVYRVSTAAQVLWSDALHVSKFYPDKLRTHKATMAKRQDLILFLANLHSTATNSGMPLGMIEIPMRLMSLRDWVQDYRIVLDHFFYVKQLGYNFGEGNHELSTLIPKPLVNHVVRAASKAAVSLKYVLPPRPEHGTISKVYVDISKTNQILRRLADTCRLDLHAPVQYLLSMPEHNFHFSPAGKLQKRDSSIWPVPAVETWPSWLREELFGPGIDIDSAYTQFLIDRIKDATKNQPNLLTMMYPDLIRSLEDKKAWRSELCTEVLGLQATDENLDKVKKLCMGLANGSKISPAILTGCRAFSVTAELVFSTVQDVSIENLTRIGKRLSRISGQYAHARRTICSWTLGTNPTRKNQKKVFSSYFEWEREARYAIWEACGRHGIMVHDGIDGIPEQYLKDIPKLIEDLNIRLTRS